MVLAFFFLFVLRTMSDKYEHTKLCSMITFLVWKNKTNTKIMKEPTSVYGTHTLKSSAVKKCVACFQSGRELVSDDVRVGWPATACNTSNIEKMKREIEKDRWKTIRDVADRTDISCMSVHKILRQNLEMKKMSLKLILKVLTHEQKKERLFIVETFLNDCKADPTLLGRIIAGDESWILIYDPSTKCQSMQWKRGDELWHRKVRMAWSQ